MNLAIKAAICGVWVSAVASTSANGAYLYLANRAVRSESEANCFSFARAVAQRNLANVRFTPSVEVAGAKGAAYAPSITCVAGDGGRPATAVVTVTSDNLKEASSPRGALVNGVARQVSFDWRQRLPDGDPGLD